MRFDVIVGNPPYQEDNENNNRDNPIYHKFYQLAEKVSDRYVLITPARFLFNAGQTPKSWNQSMLENPHLKVKFFKHKSADVFPGHDIKGGVVVLYHDSKKIYGAIDVFTPYEELNNIVNKVSQISSSSISSIHHVRSSYKFSELLLKEYPELSNRTNPNEIYSMGSNIFTRYPEIFSESANSDSDIKIFGRDGSARCYKYLPLRLIRETPNLFSWKVFVAKSIGSGALGEALSEMEVAPPGAGHTQTFISFGSFATKQEAENLVKYLKTKFARILLGVKKITQDNATKECWSKVPMQDFSPHSDIDWTLSIEEIDNQLAKKYNLNDDEVFFISNKATSMS